MLHVLVQNSSTDILVKTSFLSRLSTFEKQLLPGGMVSAEALHVTQSLTFGLDTCNSFVWHCEKPSFTPKSEVPIQMKQLLMLPQHLD